jgi:regulatory protein
MKITALKQQVKNPNRVSIYIDEAYAFSLTTDQLLEERLRLSTELDEKRLRELKIKSVDGKLRIKAMNWVFLRPRSTKELRDYLSRTSYRSKTQHANKIAASPEAASLIVEDFIRRKWVDDEAFTRWWIERSSRKSTSLSHLRSELMLKGIDRQTIADVLGDRSDSDALRQLIKKLSAKTKYKEKEKLMRYLVSKGYSYSSVTDALADGSVDNLED